MTVILPRILPPFPLADDSAARADQLRCGPSCAWIFSRLKVWPKIDAGATRVEWALHPQFRDPPPYSFQLQVGRTGLDEADDWEDVGLPVSDTFFALDDTQRVFGKFQWTHYRVILQTVHGRYASAAEPALGVLSQRMWLRAREILRLERLRLRHEAGAEGYLLKRRHFGEVCTCVDEMTGDIKNPQCTSCYGTGYVGGYFAPLPCQFAELTLGSQRHHQDLTRGSVGDVASRWRMLNLPQLFSYDVFVERDTDTRWILHDLQPLVQLQGLVLVVAATVRRVPYSHVLYQLEMPADE